ncbi:hypothetical protein MMC11_001233 [Xylographa trunciseda]|nr:hypothetical protein [Xylographa trunciseda]
MVTTKRERAIENLGKLPEELVHGVLDGLNVIRVLLLYARDDDWICHCIRTHIFYRKLFPPNGRDAQTLKQTFSLWYDIAQQNRLRYADYVFELRRPYSSFSPYDLPTIKSLMQPFRDYIAPELFVLPIYLAICGTLRLDTRVLVPSVRAGYLALDIQRKLWQCMKVSQKALNAQKSKQLYRLASLVEQYPHMLKKHLDPGVNARPNSKHIINYLQSCAEYVKKEWCFRSKSLDRRSPDWSEVPVHTPQLCCTALFRNEGLPLVPVQKYRRLFQTQLRADPPQLGGSDPPSLKRGIKALTKKWDDRGVLEKFKDIGLEPPSHIYPEDVRQDYITAIRGISERRGLRQQEIYEEVFTPDQKKAAQLSLRKYNSRHGNFPNTVVKLDELGYRRPRATLPYRLYAHNDEQLDWLEAFLKTCSYMEANLTQGVGDETTASAVAEVPDEKDSEPSLFAD